MRCTPPASTLPPEVVWYVPEPEIVFTGCRPLMPPHSLDRKGPCPVCGGGIRDVTDAVGRDRPVAVYCAQCDAMDARHEPRLERQRQETRIVERGTARERRAEEAMRDAADPDVRRPVLTEAHRRRIWFGGQAASDAIGAEPTLLAKAGREWLAAIGQLPDWGAILDRRGKVVGRVDDDQAE